MPYKPASPSTTPAALVLAALLATAHAHDARPQPPHPAPADAPLPAVRLLPSIVETKGPFKPTPVPAATPLSGQGFWRFAAATNHILPLPPEILPYIKGAHGTLIVDADRDTVFWGLEKVGWVAFSNRLSQSWVVRGDPQFSRGNLHGADLLPRRGRLPLVAVADNVLGQVYLSDTSFRHAQTLGWPATAPYQNAGEYHPTDVAFTDPARLFVTDGYGRAFFMPAATAPLAFEGPSYGGKAMSQTPHGITLDPLDHSLLVSARPEGRVHRWSPRTQAWLESLGLPAGSTVCDVALWGDYALAPCLDGPAGTPGPIYIINLKKGALVSTVHPKTELGFADAQHLHDATWYFPPKRGKQELYVLFTNWNPGGVGALRLVRSAPTEPTL
jgi:hypothetical protein